MFYRRIGNGVTAADQSLNRTNVYNRTLLLFHHKWQRRTGKILHTHQRNAKALVPFFVGGFEGSVPLFGDVRRVVAKDIEAPAPGCGAFHGSSCLGSGGNIAPDERSITTSLADLRHDSLARSLVKVGDKHIRALFSKNLGNCAAKAMRSASDNSSFIFESHFDWPAAGPFFQF